MRRHPNIAKFWLMSVRQAVNAIDNSGQRCAVARITFVRERDFLYLELPSGRQLSYPFARIYDDEQSKSFTFRDASGGRWEWYHVLKHRGAFGGLIAENATQAICRDIFCEAMLRLELAGYPIVAHLHDEVVCEVPDPPPRGNGHDSTHHAGDGFDHYSAGEAPRGAPATHYDQARRREQMAA